MGAGYVTAVTEGGPAAARRDELRAARRFNDGH